MTEPSTTRPNDRDRVSGDSKSCATCGAAVATDEWYPAATSRSDGRLSIHAFCDRACRTAWIEDRRDD